MKNLDKLKKIGFEHVGTWTISENKIFPNLTFAHKIRNALYSFVIGKEVRYIGKTTQELQRRLYGYMNPGPTQHTNINNNKKIREELKAGKVIKIFALVKTEPLVYRGMVINIAAGLEDNLIREIKPMWNFLSK
jgi:hypothetical protein